MGDTRVGLLTHFGDGPETTLCRDMVELVGAVPVLFDDDTELAPLVDDLDHLVLPVHVSTGPYLEECVAMGLRAGVPILVPECCGPEDRIAALEAHEGVEVTLYGFVFRLGEILGFWEL